jgi:hypothetical protein
MQPVVAVARLRPEHRIRVGGSAPVMIAIASPALCREPLLSRGDFTDDAKFTSVCKSAARTAKPSI